MNASFEQTVLAYLDGLMDRREERAFLQEVARDREKQAILAQYRRLNNVLRNRSTPLAVPIRTQRALAERLPALKEVIPHVVPPAVTTSGSGLASFFTRRMVSLLAGGGIVIATVTTMLLTNPFASEDTSSVSTNAVPAAAVGRESASGRSSAGATQDGSVAKSAGIPLASTPLTATPHAAGFATSEGNSSIGRGTEAGSVQAHTIAASNAVPAAPSRTSSQPDPVAARGINREQSGVFAPRGIPAFGADAPEPRFNRQRSPSVQLQELLNGRLSAYMETGAAQRQLSGSGSQARDMLNSVYLGGIRYNVSSSLAFGIEIGQSTFARESLVATRRYLEPGSGTEVIVIDRAIQDETLPWLRVHGLYTITADSRLRFEADAGAGMLLSNNNATMFSVGLSAVYPLTFGLHARAGLHYSGSWLQAADAAPFTQTGTSGVIGIIHRADKAGTVYASSVEFRIGFGILLW